MSDNPKDKPWQFQPGQSGNPSGRPKLPDSIKRLKKMTAIEVDKLLNEFMSMTKVEIDELMASDETPMLKKIVGQIFIKAAEHGDQSRLNFLLDRTAGPVKNDIDINIIPKPMVFERTDGSQVIMGTAEAIEGGADENKSGE